MSILTDQLKNIECLACKKKILFPKKLKLSEQTAQIALKNSLFQRSLETTYRWILLQMMSFLRLHHAISSSGDDKIVSRPSADEIPSLNNLF